jgi:voltage-gated potassium channel
LLGALGYKLLLDLSFIDALYQASITLSTVGFNEVRPFNDNAKIYTIFLTFAGVGSVLYIITLLTTTLVEGEVRQRFLRKLMMHRIEQTHTHTIICGYGRVGQEIGRMFQERGRPFVVLDKEEESVDYARRNGCDALAGHAEDRSTLEAAGINRASGLIACTTSDASNTYIMLCARAMCPNILLIARAQSRYSEKNLRLAGANRIISPLALGARRMAMATLQPNTAEFMDALTVGRQGDLQRDHPIQPTAMLQCVLYRTDTFRHAGAKLRAFQ